MSSTTSSDALAVHVRGYAQAVRVHLADLAPDVVEDLTDGLEADLTEALLDTTGETPAVLGGAEPGRTQPFDLTARFGPAAEYAAELRLAAGLGEAAPESHGRRERASGAVAGALSAVGARWRELSGPLTSSRAWGAALGFARSLAPVWWVLRGWVVAQVVLWSFGLRDIVLWPETTPGRILVVAAVVVSVQWGRGRWVPSWRWFPGAVAVASVAAALLAIPMMVEVEADSSRGTTAGSSYDAGWDAGWQNGFGSAQVSMVSDGGAPPTDGVWVDGMQVSNLFAYDAAGDPIRDVQLFDDRGRPVRTIAADMTWDTWSVPEVAGSWSFQPALASDGRARWNVFPLSAVLAENVDTDDIEGDLGPDTFAYPRLPTGVQPEAMPWPFLKAPTTIQGDSTVVEPGGDQLDEPAQGRPDGDDPASDHPASDHPASDPAGETQQPGERPASGSSVPEPTLEATQAD